LGAHVYPDSWQPGTRNECYQAEDREVKDRKSF
jgi:hypothetical protein